MDGITPLAPEDYYFDGPQMVFTEAYHLKRGSCCGSGCRHCPFGSAPVDAEASALDHTTAEAPSGI